MAPLGGAAEQVVGVAGGIDAGGVAAHAHERCDRAYRRVGEKRDCGFDPAGAHFGIVVEQLDEPAAGRRDSGIGSSAETAVALGADDPNVGISTREPLERAVGRSVVADQHFERDCRVRREVLKNAREAALEQAAAVVGRNHHRNEGGEARTQGDLRSGDRRGRETRAELEVRGSAGSGELRRTNRRTAGSGELRRTNPNTAGSGDPRLTDARSGVRFGCASAFVPRRLTPEDMLNRHEHDAEVEGRGPALDVVEVILDAFSQRRAAAPAVDLCPAGHADGYGVAEVVVGHGAAELGDEMGAFGSGPDQPHVTLQDVQELRKLVDVRVPQPIADPGAAAVVVRGPDRAGDALGVGAHAAKLDDAEETTPLPDSLLRIEDRPAGCDQNGYSHGEEER